MADRMWSKMTTGCDIIKDGDQMWRQRVKKSYLGVICSLLFYPTAVLVIYKFENDSMKPEQAMLANIVSI